ncbi:MAG TPA: 2'-deoxycytidine 5'-triphosphate deaminase [Candidatus Paceibacterota bacterium]
MKEKPIHGVLPDYQIQDLMDSGVLLGATSSRIQPASIDLMPDLNTLMNLKHYTLPRKGESIEKLVKELRRNGIARSASSLILPSQTHHLVRLKESLAGSDCFVRANPKSSIGRIFTHTRLICDGTSVVDEIPKEYKGELWMLLTPKFPSIKLHEYEPINQIRFFSGDARLSEHDLRRELVYKPKLVREPQMLSNKQFPITVTGNTIGQIPISVDLKGKCYRTRSTNRPLGLEERNISFQEYYEEIDPEEMKNGLVVETARGYLIGTIELFEVPQNMAIEVIVSDKFGAIQIHFAGFVDPGFGLHIGNSVTLEIVANEIGVCLRHGQYVGTVSCEWMASVPKKIYQGNYKHQEAGAKLPKYLV